VTYSIKRPRGPRSL